MQAYNSIFEANGEIKKMTFKWTNSVYKRRKCKKKITVFLIAYRT